MRTDFVLHIAMHCPHLKHKSTRSGLGTMLPDSFFVSILLGHTSTHKKHFLHVDRLKDIDSCIASMYFLL
jgi:hypothetical protein